MSPHPARTEAKAKGQTTYETGVPCARGHIAPRKVSSNGCTLCVSITDRRHRQTAPDFQLRNRLSKYRLSVDEYNMLLNQQQHRCASCQEALDGEVHVDHSHETGKVRGLLCRFCNIGLGHFKDSPERLRAAADYLERTSDAAS